MHEMGLRIINGTDAMGGYIPFDDYAVTLEMMVKGGLSAVDAILMSTREPAKVLGVYAGVLQPGYLADIIFVDGDPLNDISSIRRVRKVFREGELMYES
jgi:imidazolonepropionase-like amidohydrolase